MNEQTNDYWHQLDAKYYLPVFKRFPIAFERGKGTRIYDVEGKEYLDLLSGIAVNNVGHCHPKVVEAIKTQAETLMHISNFYVSKPQMRLAEKLVTTSGLDRAFFTNSGAESVEGAVKIARRYTRSVGRGGTVLSIDNCFHGRTLGTIAMGDREKQRPFEPLPEGFVKIPANDIDAVREHLSDDLAAIVIEPVQGEGGVHVANGEYLKQLREFCTANDVLLIFDEIQCGMGRIGTLFAWQHFDVKPDIITLAKGLGAGFPVGAVLCTEKVAGAMNYGDHGTTFGGNPLACAAALASIEVLEDEHLPAKAAEMGAWVREKFDELRLRHHSITEVRGVGLMIGVQCTFETKPLVEALNNRGILANATAGSVLRLVPPLTVTRGEFNHFFDILDEELERIEAAEQEEAETSAVAQPAGGNDGA